MGQRSKKLGQEDHRERGLQSSWLLPWAMCPIMVVLAHLEPLLSSHPPRVLHSHTQSGISLYSSL